MADVPSAGEDPEFAQKYLRSMASKAGVEVQLHVYESKQASVVTDVRGVHYRQLKSAILETLAPPTVRPGTAVFAHRDGLLAPRACQFTLQWAADRLVHGCGCSPRMQTSHSCIPVTPPLRRFWRRGARIGAVHAQYRGSGLTLCFAGNDSGPRAAGRHDRLSMLGACLPEHAHPALHTRQHQPHSRGPEADTRC